MMTAPTTKNELLVLSGLGIRYAVIGSYGTSDGEYHRFDEALTVAREKLRTGHARSFLALRIAAEVINGIGEGTDRELVRFEVYPDRVALVPTGQGGLSDEQKAKTLALPKKRLL